MDKTAPSIRAWVVETGRRQFGSHRIHGLDGRHLATLLWGDSITCELEPGPHRLRVHNTLVWKTIEFDVAAGDDLHVEIVNRAAPGMLALVALFGAGPMYVTMDFKR